MSRVRAALALAALALIATASSAGASAPKFNGTWRGTFSLPTPVPFSVQVAGKRATVTLPGRTSVARQPSPRTSPAIGCTSLYPADRPASPSTGISARGSTRAR